MAKQLIWAAGRIIWAETVGKPLHYEAGITTTTTIPTTGTSSCPNSWPEMYLTVLDSDYSDGSGNITWCGETWTPTEVRTGVVKGPVCPTRYSAFKGSVKYGPYPGYTNTYLQAYNAWEFSPNELIMLRGYGVARFYGAGNWYRGGFFFATNREQLTIKGVYDQFQFINYAGVPSRPPVPYTALNNPVANLGHILQGTYPTYTALISDPTYSDYKFPASFFSPYITGLGKGTGVDIGGVSYYWQKGNGW